ncbi:ankyrin repeat domain-containing protein [Lentzea sp.]|uniref:ankyrin repeat domain-containing protein n=1 Tax=Lentzea sp. TaxID=56099 RepID=UPI002B778BF7|nr:ankyrin repeat domain-containing protein [Lentzea sp.]HUQ59748.1 ankyrin repeat domain-containing protein [Lentzea sp.]
MWHPYRDDVEYYEERARGLLASAWDGVPGALEVFEDVPLTDEGARMVLAQAHGCQDWKALEANIRRPRPFARAYQAIEMRNPGELKAIITRDPWLVKASGTNGNDLLGLSAATRDERLVEVLLNDGADINHQNVHGWTALHQAAYANLPGLAGLLLGRGARTDLEARGEGGTPLTVALFWGNRETAELLGDDPPNLRTAAGLGDLDLATQPEAKRGYYRPHSGFPRWWPTDDPQEVLDEALSWAARNDRVEVLGDLLKRGARIDADVYRGTALAWAAYRGLENATRALLDLGANPDQRTGFGGPMHGEGVTALHLAAERGHLPVIRMLLDAGADRTITDANFEATPAHWAGHNDQREAQALLSA